MENISTQSTLASLSLISICTYLWIDVKILWLYTALLCIDFITWFIKWISTKTFKSSVAINWVAKKLVLIFLIFSIWVTWKIVWFENLRWLMSFSFSSLAIAELYSILANIYEIKTWHRTKEFDWVAFIISSFLKFIENKIKKIDTNINANDNEKRTK